MHSSSAVVDALPKAKKGEKKGGEYVLKVIQIGEVNINETLKRNTEKKFTMAVVVLTQATNP